MPDLRLEPREAGEDIVTEEQQLGHTGGPQGPEHLVQVAFSLSLVVSQWCSVLHRIHSFIGSWQNCLIHTRRAFGPGRVRSCIELALVVIPMY